MRPVKPCPSKAYLMTLPCASLALYWKTALGGQLAELVDVEDKALQLVPWERRSSWR